jgi:hypothetical protein
MSDDKLIMDKTLGRTWREAVMDCFKVLSQDFPGGPRFDCGTPEHQSQVLTTIHRRVFPLLILVMGIVYLI